MSRWLMRATKINVREFAQNLNIDIVSAKILANRGICDCDRAVKFLNPSVDNMYNAFDMKDMDKGIEIIANSIENQKKIAIYGDYDADGIMSTVILFKSLKRCNADVIYYIPDRESEGYGMNIDSVYKLFDMGVDTILTCDNGIAAIYEIDEAKKLGMTVVVIDHHDVRFENEQQLLPNADAAIDAKRVDSQYPFKDMCAAGVVYKFAVELYKTMGIDENEAYNFIMYAAIATICDVVDLKDENRIIVKIGLKVLNSTNDIGIKSLIEHTKLSDKKIGVYQVGFILGPCINATGRLELATTAVKLFTTDSYEEADKLADKLVQLNNSRKSMTDIAVKRAIESIESGEFKDDRVIVLYDETIHESIAGIVAGKIREHYYLPTIVLTKGEIMAKGSARSIDEYNIFEELCKCSELLEKFGGHPLAAGMTLKYENIIPLRKKLNQICKLTSTDIIPKIRIDIQLPIDYISFDLIENIDRLAPFGKGNESPLFAEKNISVFRIDFLGKEKKILKFKCVSPNNRIIDALSFDGYEKFKAIVYEKFGESKFSSIQSSANIELNLDMIYTVNVNQYRNNSILQMVVKDFRISK